MLLARTFDDTFLKVVCQPLQVLYLFQQAFSVRRLPVAWCLLQRQGQDRSIVSRLSRRSRRETSPLYSNLLTGFRPKEAVLPAGRAIGTWQRPVTPELPRPAEGARVVALARGPHNVRHVESEARIESCSFRGSCEWAPRVFSRGLLPRPGGL